MTFKQDKNVYGTLDSMDKSYLEFCLDEMDDLIITLADKTRIYNDDEARNKALQDLGGAIVFAMSQMTREIEALREEQDVMEKDDLRYYSLSDEELEYIRNKSKEMAKEARDIRTNFED